MDCGAAPLFVAGDEARGTSTMVVPAEFRALSNLHAEVAAAARELDAEMRRAIATEGWPPPQSARRTRVSFAGSLRCWKCARLFSKQWAYRGVCWECEGTLRAAGACPFDQAEGRARAGGRAAAHAFCRHQQRCAVLGSHSHLHLHSHLGPGSGSGIGSSASPNPSPLTLTLPLIRCAVCDGGFAPCRECRLAQGDGETVRTLTLSVSLSLTVFLTLTLTLTLTRRRRGGRNAVRRAAG